MDRKTADNLQKSFLKYSNLLTAAVFFLFLFSLNRGVGNCTDDWHFKFVFRGFWPYNGVQRIETLKDLLSSASMYYQLSGGRVLAHSLTFALLMLPSWTFDLLNAGMFVVFGYLVFLTVPSEGWRKHWYALPVTYLGIILFSFSFGDSAVWLSGAVNYLWMGTLNLCAVLFFEKRINSKRTWLDGIILMVLFFLAGQSNETTGGMLLILIFLHYIYSPENRKQNAIFSLLAVLSVVLGMSIVLMAPGNHNRAVLVHGGQASFQSIKDCVIGFLIELMNRFWILFALFLYCGIENENDRKWKLFTGLYQARFAVMGVMGTLALGLSNTLIMRGTFLPVVYLLAAGCSCIQDILEEHRQGRQRDWPNRAGLRKLILVFLGMDAIYLCAVFMRSGGQFEERDITFLLRGAGICGLFLLVPYLYRNRDGYTKFIKFGKICIAGILVTAIGIVGFEQISLFRNNACKQWELEEKVRSFVERPEEKILINWPIYQKSVFWPEEASVSAEYTKAWMVEYFRYELESGID